MERFRRLLVISVMFTTVLAMSVVAVPNLEAAASAGDLIKMDGLSSVYYLGADGKRYVFPNEQTYFSWYSDFSGVVTIPQSELEGYSLGANVTIRPGTKLVKITTDPKVYAVEADGTLVWVPSEAVALALYGENWAQRVIDVPDGFFTNYTVSSSEVSATAYPQGSLVKFTGSEDVYVINADGTASKVASEAAFAANRFAWANVLDAPESITLPTVGTEIAGADSTIIDTSSGAGGTAGAGTGLTVALSGATSVSSTLVTGQAIANLGSFNFTAANDGDVAITNLQMKRLGVSADATLAAIYLYDGVTRLTDSASVSSGYITWNTPSGIFTVPAGTTKTITVKSNIKTSTSGQTVGVALLAASSVTTNGASVSGSCPINSNIHSIAEANLASASFGAVTPSGDGQPSPQDEFTLWSSDVLVGTRAVDLGYITFRQIGSVAIADLANFKLFIGGVQVGETVASMNANGYITFDITASPYRLETGTKTFKVLVDMIGGSTRTTSLSLRQTSDVSIIDTEYDVPCLATAESATFSARSSGTQIIAGGALTITKKNDSVSGNIVNGASNVTLASYTFKATGEPIKVESLRANAVVSKATVDELRSGKIYVNGKQVGSTANLAASDGTAAYYTEYTSLNFTVVPGSPATVEIKADVYDSDAGGNHIAANDTIKAQIASSSNNVQKTVSLEYTAAPTTDKAGSTLTVKQGALTMSKYTGYTNHSIVAPKTVYKLGEFRLTSDTTEAVNVTSFVVDFANSTGDINSVSDLSDVYIVYGSTTGVAKATIASTTDNTWNISSLTLAAGETIAVSVYGDVSSSIGTSTEIITKMGAYGTTVSSSQTANSSNLDTVGQTITIGTGSMTIAATETPLDQIVYGGQTVTAANYELTAANDSYTVEEVCIKFSGIDVTDAVNAVYLYDGDTLLNPGGTSMNGAYATTTGLTLAVPANVTKTITVMLGLNSVGTGMATPGRNVLATLDTVVSRNGTGTQEYDSLDAAGNEAEGNKVYVYKSYPVVSHVQLSTADRQIVNDSSQTVYQFTVTPSAGGSVALKQVTLGLSWSDLGPVSTNNLLLKYFKLYRGTTDISSLITVVDSTGANVKGLGGASSSVPSTGVVIAWTTEEVVSSATTFTVKATPANFDSGTTSSDSVTLALAGDTAAHNGTSVYVGDQTNNKIWGLGTAAATTNTEYYFIWSDRSAVGHSSVSGSSTADWANGYLVDYLPLSTTRMVM